MTETNNKFRENLIIWRSPYLTDYQKDRLFLKELFPELQRIVKLAYNKSNLFLCKEDKEDALQEGYLKAFMFVTGADLLKYDDPAGPIFLSIKGGIISAFRSMINKRIHVGEAFRIALEKGWNFDSDILQGEHKRGNTYSNNQGSELLYPVFESPEEQTSLKDLFGSIFSIRLYDAIQKEWKEIDQVSKSDLEWRKFFGVENRNYGGKFHGSVFKKAVREYNSLLNEKLTIKKHFGVNQKVTGYTLFIRNKPEESPRLSLMHSERLYEYFIKNLKQEIRLTGDEFRELFKIEGKSYQNNSTLFNRIIQRSISEIKKKTDLDIYCEIERGRTTTVSINSFTFYATLNHKNND